MSKKPDKSPELNINPSNPTIWVDSMNLGISESQDMLQVSLGSMNAMTGSVFESVRFQTSMVHMRQMLEAMAQVTNYYPSRPTEKQKTGEEAG
ncbi:MAG: hypothetical protein AAF916_00100 [Planctomycetota bacterium]